MLYVQTVLITDSDKILSIFNVDRHILSVNSCLGTLCTRNQILVKSDFQIFQY